MCWKPRKMFLSVTPSPFISLPLPLPSSCPFHYPSHFLLLFYGHLTFLSWHYFCLSLEDLPHSLPFSISPSYLPLTSRSLKWVLFITTFSWPPFHDLPFITSTFHLPVVTSASLWFPSILWPTFHGPFPFLPSLISPYFFPLPSIISASQYFSFCCGIECGWRFCCCSCSLTRPSSGNGAGLKPLLLLQDLLLKASIYPHISCFGCETCLMLLLLQDLQLRACWGASPAPLLLLLWSWTRLMLWLWRNISRIYSCLTPPPGS